MEVSDGMKEESLPPTLGMDGKKDLPIKMGLGQSPFQPPYSLIDAYSKAVKIPSLTKYQDPRGLKQLREAIAKQETLEEDGLKDADNVVVAPGAKAALTAMLAALKMQKFSTLILPVWHWSGYKPLADLFGFDVFTYDWMEQEEMAKYIERLFVGRGLKGCIFVVTSPGNPWPRVPHMKNIQHVRNLLETYVPEKACMLIDNVYAGFAEPLKGPLKGTTPIAVLRGISKTMGAAGWRCGWLSFSEREMANQVTKAAATMWTCTNAPLQYAVWKKLKKPSEGYAKRTKMLMRALVQSVDTCMPGSRPSTASHDGFFIVRKFTN